MTNNMYESPIVIIDCDKKPNPCYKKLLHCIDAILSSYLIAPLVVAYWRSTWNLLDYYLIPDNPFQSALASVFIGLVGYMIFMLPQKLFCDNLDPDKNRLTFYVASRLYTCVFGVISILGCRGPWNLTDLLSPSDLYSVILLTLLAIILLIVSRSLANISAPPFLISTDERDDYFLITTRFNTSATREPGLYIFDCFFSSVIIGSLVAIVWRGVWASFDIVLYPEDEESSAIASVLIGYAIGGIAFALQPTMRWICEQITGYWRIAIADAFLLFSFFGTINIWRGIWLLLDLYFIPDDPFLSNWLTHGLSFVLLMLLNCSNSILVRGVFIDAEEPSGKCAMFPIYYVREFFHKQRIQKYKYFIDLLKQPKQNCTIVILENCQQTTINVIKLNNKNIIIDDRESSQNSNSSDYTPDNCMEESCVLLNEKNNLSFV